MSSSFITPRRRRVTVAAAVAVGVAVAAAVQPGAATPDPDPDPSLNFGKAGRYVVLLAEQPAATYRGGAGDLRATAPEVGQDFQADAADTRRYRAHLKGQQAELAAAVGVTPEERYTVALNGFTAELDARQAARLQGDPRVLAVVEDTAHSLDTVASPEFLGLPGDDGVWSELGGAGEAGHGIVVGVIDTGIWPENASFAGDQITAEPTTDVGEPYWTSDTETAMVKANGELFTGACETGEKWTTDLCTDKVVSARYFPDGFLDSVDEERIGESEFISPRDGAGHGTHVAGTAAGNHGVPMSVDGQDFGEGSGMAPAAHIASYKVCWEDNDPETGGCFISDMVAAIDQAVADNVDVINMSIGGIRDTAMDVISLAFLSAASADIFVATSAGNEGPAPSTVAHNNPWVTTVAASTHATYEGTVELGDGRRFRGSMLDDAGLGKQAPLVWAGDIAADGADPAQATLCAENTLDGERATGAIVLCDRGQYPRVDKSGEVARAGGVGMILGNIEPSESLDADNHAVPTVHLAAGDADQVRDYVGATTEPTAALLPGDQTGLPPMPTPVLAGFSSRGPAAANGGDLLKPDIAAPGVSVLAPLSPGPRGDGPFGFSSGTSMASPHIAGLGALVRATHPDWSPAAVKSAMMTSAYDLVNPDGSADTDRFGSGAGHVDPTRFLSPGLVYDATVEDWLSFLAGTGEELGIPGVEPVDPSDLNYPSIAVGSLAGRQQVVREVTATTPGLYRARVDVPGFTARVTPSVLHFTEAGQTKRFRVVLTRDSAALDEYAKGTLTWSGSGTTVRSPIVVKPVAVDAPEQVTGSGPAGGLDFDVVPGGSEEIGVQLQGLSPGEVTSGSLAPGEPPSTGGNTSSQLIPFEVPEGTTLARFDLRAADQNADFDIYLFGPDGQQLPVEGATPASSEQVDVTDPQAGQHWILVHLYSAPDGAPTDFTVRNFAVGDGPAGNATISPESIKGRQGRPITMTVDYQGLTEGVPYLGRVTYDGSDTSTIVAIE